MRTIHKQIIPFNIGEYFNIALPEGSQIIRFAYQGEGENKDLCIWYLFDYHPFKEIHVTKRKFCIIGTGDTIDYNEHYVGTVEDQEFIWHLFEVIETKEK